MGVALVVSLRQAVQLYRVAAHQAGIAEPDALIRVHSQAGVVVIMQGTDVGEFPPALDSRRSRQFLGQIRDRDEPFRLVYGLSVGAPPISGDALVAVLR